MRVGVNATFLGDRPTGIGAFTAELCRALAAANADLVVFSSAAVAGVLPASRHGSPLATRGSPRLLNNLCRFLYLNTAFPPACRARGVDVLFSPLAEFPFTKALPQVVHVHDMHPLRYGSQFGLSSLHFRIAMSRLPRCARRVSVSSSFGRDEVLRFTRVPAERIDVVPLAFDRRLFVPRERGLREEFCRRYGLKGEYILFVGSLFPYKNVKTLIGAFQGIRGRTACSLVIVGRRDLSPEPLPTDERIRFMDYVPVEDLPGFYSFAGAYVHPSLGEGFGIPPLEAMACGTPVVTSNAGSLPEVVGDAGLYFDPLDSAALGSRILEVLSRGQLRLDLIERGFRQARRFSWEKTAAGVMASCGKAVAGR